MTFYQFFCRLVNNRASGVKPYNIINPIGMGIKAIGGTEELYEGLIIMLQ